MELFPEAWVGAHLRVDMLGGTCRNIAITLATLKMGTSCVWLGCAPSAHVRAASSKWRQSCLVESLGKKAGLEGLH